MSFTPETSAEDAQSVMELHRQMEQSGQLQDRNRAAQLLKTAEDAMMNVHNAQALGLMNAQEGYDTEIGLQKVINNTRAILTDTQNGDTRKTPAQMTAPENNIGGISHIIQKHGIDVAKDVIEVIAKGTESDIQKNDMVSEGHHRVRIYYNGYSAVLNKSPNENHWLFTGWKNNEETGASATVEVYDSTSATADGTTRFHPNGVNATVSKDIISDKNGNINPSNENNSKENGDRFSIDDENDAAYHSLAEKYRDGKATEEETEQLRQMVDEAAKN